MAELLDPKNNDGVQTEGLVDMSEENFEIAYRFSKSISQANLFLENRKGVMR